jgi:ABC-type branched-subunit amino acid transport system substrate-binding protein
VKAAFNYLNDHGGLGTEHAKVTVKVCNTNLTPQGEIQCAQQAASDPNAIAVIGAINVLAGPQVATVLQKAGLATVNPAVADSSETTSPISFPLAAENLAPTGCALMMPSALKATKIGFAYTSTPATQGEINTAIASAGKAGVTSVGTVSFPITSSDLSPFVEQLAQKNPQAVTLVGSPQDVGQWLTAQARLGKTAPRPPATSTWRGSTRTRTRPPTRCSHSSASRRRRRSRLATRRQASHRPTMRARCSPAGSARRP